MSVLAVTLPLALRRRFPLAVACVVTVAFVVGRVTVNPGVPGLASWENYLTQWACWLALYSVVVYGRRARRTIVVLAVLVATLLAEVVRDVLFYQGGVYKGLPLNQAFVIVYSAAFMVFSVAARRRGSHPARTRAGIDRANTRAAARA